MARKSTAPAPDVELSDEQRLDAQQEPEWPPPPADPVPYLVLGPHRVAEVAPGDVVHLNPEAPQTQRLLARQQIVAAETTTGNKE